MVRMYGVINLLGFWKRVSLLEKGILSVIEWFKNTRFGGTEVYEI